MFNTESLQIWLLSSSLLLWRRRWRSRRQLQLLWQQEWRVQLLWLRLLLSGSDNKVSLLEFGVQTLEVRSRCMMPRLWMYLRPLATSHARRMRSGHDSSCDLLAISRSRLPPLTNCHQHHHMYIISDVTVSCCITAEFEQVLTLHFCTSIFPLTFFVFFHSASPFPGSSSSHLLSLLIPSTYVCVTNPKLKITHKFDQIQ